MVVLDASALVDVLLRRGDRGAWVGDAIADFPVVVAPHLLEVELLSSLRRLVLLDKLTPEHGRLALARFLAFGVRLYPSTRTLGRIWELRDSLSAYDAAYVALAEALDLPLVTTDERLGRSRGHRAKLVAYST